MNKLCMIGFAVAVSLMLAACGDKDELTDEDSKNGELLDCCQVGTSRASLLAAHASSATSGASPTSGEIAKPE